jgi:tetratricopeptide (TPR) repeat protein
VRGQAYLRSGRPDLAFQLVHDVRDNEPGAGEAMAVAGTALIRMNQFRLARLALDRALNLRPDDWAVAATLGQLNIDLGNGQGGAEVLEKAIRLRPRDARLRLTLAKVYRDLGDFLRASEAYQQVLRQWPGHRTALTELLQNFLMSGQSHLAEPWLSEALRRYPDDPEILGIAAVCAIDANRPDDALALAGRSLSRDSRNGRALIARARARVASGQWNEALLDAEQVASASRDDPTVLQLLGAIERHLGLDDRAAATLARRLEVLKRGDQISKLTEKIALEPDAPVHPWKIGLLALESGEARLARRCFEAALALDNSYKPARQSLDGLKTSHPEAFVHAEAPAVGPGSRSSLAVEGAGRGEGH